MELEIGPATTLTPSYACHSVGAGEPSETFLVGLERSYQCQYDGELRVGPNDRSPGDSVGWLQVDVTRIPAE